MTSKSTASAFIKSLLFWLGIIGLSQSFSLIDPLLPFVPEEIFNIPMKEILFFSWAIFIFLTCIVLLYWKHPGEECYRLLTSWMKDRLWAKNKRFNGRLALILIAMFFCAMIFKNPSKTRPDLLIIILFGPFVEELFFRGLLWDLISNKLNVVAKPHRITSVLIITSVLFGLHHWSTMAPRVLSLFVLNIIGTGLMGVLFGIIRWRADSLSSAFLVHASCNAFWNIVLPLTPLFFLQTK
jgi:hypothetical protein